MWIFNNLVYKVVAVAVALVLWLTAQGFRSVEQSLDLPVAVQNLPEGLVVVSQSTSEINLMLEGSRAALRSAEKNLVRYPISLEDAKPGQRSVPVMFDPRSLPRGAEVRARAPSTVELEIERVVSKKLPVRVDLGGEPPEGYRVTRVEVEPREVVIEGARRSVRQLREALTDRVDVSRLRETTVREVPLSLGLPYVWRAGNGQRGEPVRVEIVVERAQAPDGGA